MDFRKKLSRNILVHTVGKGDCEKNLEWEKNKSGIFEGYTYKSLPRAILKKRGFRIESKYYVVEDGLQGCPYFLHSLTFYWFIAQQGNSIFKTSCFEKLKVCHFHIFKQGLAIA